MNLGVVETEREERQVDLSACASNAAVLRDLPVSRARAASNLRSVVLDRDP